MSKSYVKLQTDNGGALNHGVYGRIDPSDNDGTLHDCYLQQNEHPGFTDGMNIPAKAATNPSATRVRVNLSGEAKNGLVPISPSIQWNFSIDIETGTPTPRVFVNGSRDRFPAYEIYVNGQNVYHFAPTGLSESQLPVERFGMLDLAGLFTNESIKPVQTALNN